MLKRSSLVVSKASVRDRSLHDSGSRRSSSPRHRRHSSMTSSRGVAAMDLQKEVLFFLSNVCVRACVCVCVCGELKSQCGNAAAGGVLTSYFCVSTFSCVCVLFFSSLCVFFCLLAFEQHKRNAVSQLHREMSYLGPSNKAEASSWFFFLVLLPGSGHTRRLQHAVKHTYIHAGVTPRTRGPRSFPGSLHPRRQQLTVKLRLDRGSCDARKARKTK